MEESVQDEVRGGFCSTGVGKVGGLPCLSTPPREGTERVTREGEGKAVISLRIEYMKI